MAVVQMVKINGQRMTTYERNRLMKMDYIAGGYSINDLAAKYDMIPTSCSTLITKEGWAKEKKAFCNRADEAAKSTVVQVYANFKADIVIQYNEAWQKVFMMVSEMLNEPKRHFYNSAGQLKVGTLQAVAEVLERCQASQSVLSGFVDNASNIHINIQREKLNLMKTEMLGNPDNIVEDNFINALQEATDKLWEDDSEDEPKES